jgi:hypothetical protein
MTTLVYQKQDKNALAKQTNQGVGEYGPIQLNVK